MKIKRFFAILLVLAAAFSAFPTGASSDPWSSLIVGESFYDVLWKGYNEDDDVVIVSGELPDGVELVKEYNETEGVYDFIIKGTPLKAGEYPVSFEICPAEAMHSYADITFSVWNKLKITVSRLPDAEVGQYYSQKIPVTYQEAEFTEWWNPGEGAILNSLGLELRSDGTVCGTPTAAGSFHFYVTVNSLLNMDYDEATIEIKIDPPAVPTEAPTPAPTIAPPPVFSGVDARFEADSFITFTPGEELEIMLLSGVGEGVEIGGVIGDIPEGVKVIVDTFNGEVTVTGASPESAFYVTVPLTTEGAVLYVNYLFRPAAQAETEEYPEGMPMKAPFGA